MIQFILPQLNDLEMFHCLKSEISVKGGSWLMTLHLAMSAVLQAQMQPGGRNVCVPIFCQQDPMKRPKPKIYQSQYFPIYLPCLSAPSSFIHTLIIFSKHLWNRTKYYFSAIDLGAEYLHQQDMLQYVTQNKLLWPCSLKWSYISPTWIVLVFSS